MTERKWPHDYKDFVPKFLPSAVQLFVQHGGASLEMLEYHLNVTHGEAWHLLNLASQRGFVLDSDPYQEGLLRIDEEKCCLYIRTFRKVW